MSKMYAMFEGDSSLEQDGIWLDYTEFRIRAAHAGGANKSYAKLLDAKTKHLRRAIQTGSVQEDTLNTILIHVFAETIVRDWEVLDEDTGEWKRGIHDRDGNVIPVTQENVIKTFKALPNLFANVRDAVTNNTLYRKEELEEDAKNS